MRLFLPGLLAALLFPSTHWARQKENSKTAAVSVAPLIDGETWAVARLDLTRLDLARGFVLLQGIIPGQQDLKPFEEGIRGWQTAFRKQGGSEIWVVYGGSNFPQMPCWLVPVAQWREGETLLEMLRVFQDQTPLTSRKLGAFLAVGTPAALDQLQATKPVERPDLLEAFADAGDAPFRLAFSPSASARKTIAELVPELPKELGGGPVRTLTQGMKWLSLRMDEAPGYRIRLAVQAADAPSAEGLAGVWNKLVLLLGEEQLPEASVSRVFFKWYQRVKELLTPRVTGDRVEVVIDSAAALPELAALGRQLDGSAERSRSMNNLKQLLLALHGYHDTYGHLPADVTDKNGKPLLSWRVLILPFVEQEQLYQRFKLDEAWDSEHNRKLLAEMPKVFRSPRQAATLADRTTYLGPAGKGLMFERGIKLKLHEIPDGTSNTIALVECDDEQAQPWTKPEDLAIDPEKPQQHLLGHYTDGMVVGLGDGSVRFLRKDTPSLYFWFTRAGGEVVETNPRVKPPLKAPKDAPLKK